MKILLAEDDRTTRLIIAATLKKLGHEVVLAENGTIAWELLQKPDAPKTVILDWMMPGLDGHEVCQRIRSASLPYRYILMQTSKDSKEDIEAGFAVGVDDYLVKPLDPEALRHKLHVAERVLQYENKLESYATQMENLAKERAKQLIHADRMATLGMLSAGVAHEINNPLTFISGNAQILDKAWKGFSLFMEKQSPDVQGQFSYLKDDIPQILSGVQVGVGRISKIVSGLKRFAKQESVHQAPFVMSQAIHNSLELCHSKLRNLVHVSESIQESLPLAFGDQQQIEQVLINLIMNAADAMHRQASAHLHIQCISKEKQICVQIKDNGPGLPPKLLQSLVNPFFTTKDEGTGLGLSISQSIIEEHGGTLRAFNNSDQGATFEFQIPIAESGIQ